MSTKEQERLAAGIKIVASAVLSAGGATPEQRELARAVLGATEAAEFDRGHNAPREAATIADAFNRHMDVVIEAVDRTRGADERALRRARVAPMLERAGLVIVDQAELARMFAVRCELDLARGRIAQLEAVADDGDSFGAELLEDEAPFDQDPNVND